MAGRFILASKQKSKVLPRRSVGNARNLSTLRLSGRAVTGFWATLAPNLSTRLRSELLDVSARHEGLKLWYVRVSFSPRSWELWIGGLLPRRIGLRRLQHDWLPRVRSCSSCGRQALGRLQAIAVGTVKPEVWKRDHRQQTGMRWPCPPPGPSFRASHIFRAGADATLARRRGFNPGRRGIAFVTVYRRRANLAIGRALLLSCGTNRTPRV